MVSCFQEQQFLIFVMQYDYLQYHIMLLQRLLLLLQQLLQQHFLSIQFLVSSAIDTASAVVNFSAAAATVSTPVSKRA
jgi:hypothetical protein